MTSRTTWVRLLALLLAFGLIAAACGDDDADTTEAGETDTDEAADTAASYLGEAAPLSPSRRTVEDRA